MARQENSSAASASSISWDVAALRESNYCATR
jgi:hypothetical protein